MNELDYRRSEMGRKCSFGGMHRRELFSLFSLLISDMLITSSIMQCENNGTSPSYARDGITIDF